MESHNLNTRKEPAEQSERGLMDVTIMLPKAVYNHGESITGILEVAADKEFDSKSTSITFTGRVKASAKGVPRYSGGKMHQETAKLDTNIIDGSIVIAEEQHYPKGTHRFSFSFNLPSSTIAFRENLEIRSGMIPSHNGSEASVEYILSAAVKISMLKTLKAQIPITIIIPLNEYPKVVKNEKSLDDIVFLETDSDLFCIGKPYEIRYRIKEGAKIKEIQLEFVKTENVSLQRCFASSSQSLYKTKLIPQGNTSEWQTVVLEPDVEIPQSFKCDFLTCTLQLNVTAELGRFNKIKETLHLLAHHCPDTERPI